MDRTSRDRNVAALIEALQQEALRQSEARWRGYFEMSAIGVAVLSPEKVWIEVNDAICKMFGYTREEFRARTWAELTHPDSELRRRLIVAVG